ncbi:hypothetical protein GP486_003433 [Trichoglossum hirsutum]|uniref:SGNH hydrolase-type esterase domain-containing protein n=1 Tax=Trichoglossum hirsutum TaxID=265104 RepID=A0A9P8LD50_9PEZI|nr:hypothetical protein GP486_003433 [Trichoglossum hirsutum]
MWTPQAAALLFWLAHVSASPVVVDRDTANLTQTPKTYAALGDSYAAGIGAGKYFSLNDDGDSKKCKRFDGGYPQKVFQADPFKGQNPKQFYFKACSGDVLDGIDNQIKKVGGNKVEVVTLSISGNDFGFGNVVRKCVYAYSYIGSPKQKDCDDALSQSDDLVNQNAVWQKYQDKVNLIKLNLLNPSNQLLVITGYSKFFAQPVQGDACDKISFMRIIGANGLKMTADNRSKMNALVTKVNQKIFENIVLRNRNTIMIDIDTPFEGHRFCEQGNSNDPIGANNDNVWFFDLQSKLQESDYESDGSAEDAAWDDWAHGFEGHVSTLSNNPDALLPGKLTQASVFHPKGPGHDQSASRISQAIHNNLPQA